MKRLEPLLNLNGKTVSGKTVRENLKEVMVRDEEIVRPPR